MLGNASDHTLSGLGGADVIYAGDGDDIVDGGIGNDTITAGAGSDAIEAGADNDYIYSALSDDANDTINGDTGNDTLDYSADAGIGGAETTTIDMQNGEAYINGEAVNKDTFSSIENIIATDQNDTIIDKTAVEANSYDLSLIHI